MLARLPDLQQKLEDGIKRYVAHAYRGA